MAALTLKWIRLRPLALVVALALAPPALAADVSVQLDAGSGFSIKNNTGAIERLRVDEATGNVSRNGALFVHTTGTDNTFVGVGAGNTSTTGLGRNTALGRSALSFNTTGTGNSAVGDAALRSNTTGSGNSAVGYAALRSNTTGFYNSAFGDAALRSNTTGYANSAFGNAALLSNTTGTANSAVGSYALRSNTTGFSNSAFGYDALRSNTTGPANSAFGSRALSNNSTGGSNSAFGYDALSQTTTGFQNSAFGYRALRFNTTGNGNSAFGFLAMQYTTGLRNTAMGDWALRFTTGSYNVALGTRAGVNQSTGSNNIYLAHSGVAAESGRIRIGNLLNHTATFVAGIRGVTTVNANAIPVLIDSVGQLGTVSSSRSVKREIRDMGAATDRLLALRPVMFRYKQEQTLPSGELPPEYGLIAEEVAEVFPDLVVYDEAGLPFTVKYHVMAPMLLNEMKKQQRTIEAQRREMHTQQQTQHEKFQAQEQEIAALTTRLAMLEARK